jgi:hypothetical protein
MSSWVSTVRQFYMDKMVQNGFNLDETAEFGIPQNVPQGVLDAYNYLGGEDSDPLPGFYTFKIQEQDTYAVNLTWDGEDGWMGVLDNQGQLIGAAYIPYARDMSSIKWYDSLAAAMQGD